MKRYSTLLIGLLFILISCGPEPEVLIEHLDGYWEISHVKKGNQIIREFSTSPIIDYWEVGEDRTGFRKKVMPNLDGKLIITQHRAPFTIKIENGKPVIHYDDNGNTFSETIISASAEELILANEDGMTYTYKPYKQSTTDNE